MESVHIVVLERREDRGARFELMSASPQETYDETDENNGETRTLEPLTRLLAAHAALIRETSDTMANALIEAVNRLLDEADPASLEDERSAKLQARIGELATHLQVQDILRQQILVLEKGLEVVSAARIPDDESPEDWYLNAVSDIENAYVMQSQYTLHSNVLGLPEKTLEDEDSGEIFF